MLGREGERQLFVSLLLLSLELDLADHFSITIAREFVLIRIRWAQMVPPAPGSLVLINSEVV